jgi:hypothetical protein
MKNTAVTVCGKASYQTRDLLVAGHVNLTTN